MQRRSIVGAVARHSHHLVQPPQRLHQPFLVHRSGPCDNLYPHRPLLQLFVGERSQLGASDDVVVAVGSRPQPYLSAYLASRARRVAGHDLHCYASPHALLHRLLHSLANVVLQGEHTDEVQLPSRHPSVGKRRLVVVQHLVGQCQRAHRPVLIGRQRSLIVVPGGIVDVRHGQQHLRSTFHVDHPSAEYGRPSHRRHVFILRREGQRVLHAGVLPHVLIVHTPAVQPQQQRSLRRIANHFYL